MVRMTHAVTEGGHTIDENVIDAVGIDRGVLERRVVPNSIEAEDHHISRSTDAQITPISEPDPVGGKPG